MNGGKRTVEFPPNVSGLRDPPAQINGIGVVRLGDPRGGRHSVSDWRLQHARERRRRELVGEPAQELSLGSARGLRGALEAAGQLRGDRLEARRILLTELLKLDE
jgi:hypothetical protein